MKTRNTMTKSMHFMKKSRMSRNKPLRASHRRTRSSTRSQTSMAAMKGRGVFKGPMNFAG